MTAVHILVMHGLNRSNSYFILRNFKVDKTIILVKLHRLIKILSYEWTVRMNHLSKSKEMIDL